LDDWFDNRKLEDGDKLRLHQSIEVENILTKEEDEEQAMLTRLIKIRKGLWT
jgi:hypothetical protein